MSFKNKPLSWLITSILAGSCASVVAAEVIEGAVSYENGSTYAVGTVVEHNGNYYRCEGAFAAYCGNSAYEPGNANGFWQTGAWTLVGPVPSESNAPEGEELSVMTEIDFYHGEIWGTTSSVEYVFAADLAEMVITYPANSIADITHAWGADASIERTGSSDIITLTKKADITYEVTQVGFNLVLQDGGEFRSLAAISAVLNGESVQVKNNGVKAGAVAVETSPVPGFDPFPKTIDDRVVTHYRSNKATHKTFKNPTYTDETGKEQEYLLGGYYTDWGVYSPTAYTPNELPVNNMNFIQVSFAAICSEGDASNWFGNESATIEAKPKIAELCADKPTGTMIIPDHWAHYGKPDMNLPEWKREWNQTAYHVLDYARFTPNPFASTPTKEFYNVGEVALREQGGFDYAWGLKNDLSHMERVLNRNGKNFDMYLSIGGWTLSDPFPVIAANPSYRATFINSVVNYLRLNEHITGIDLDWEFVGVDGAKSGIMSDRDTNNHTKLVYELRRALDALGSQRGVAYQLSSAMGTAPKHLAKVNWQPVTIDGVDYPGIGDMLDHIFMMSYDYYGAWDNTVGHHTALYTNGELEGHSIDSAVQYLKQQGINSRKLIIGYAGYGRLWANVSPSEYNTSGQYAFPTQAEGHSPGDIGTLEAANVAWRHIKATAFDEQGNLKAGYEFIRDEQAKAEYLVATNPDDNSKNVIVTLDTPWSVQKKAEYVVAQKLGGMFTWALDNDDGDLLNAANSGLGAAKLYDDMRPTARENSLILYRSKEAEFCSNPHTKLAYANEVLTDYVLNFLTLGVSGLSQTIEAGINAFIDAVTVDNKTVLELSDEEWQMYFDVIRGLETANGQPIDESKLSKEYVTKLADSVLEAGAGAAADALLTSTPLLLDLGISIGSDFVLDFIIPANGDYCDRITRDTLDPWQQLSKDHPELKHNFGY